MLIEEDTAHALQNYLIKVLEPISAADPSVLSTYVTALLKNDKPREQLQKFCEEELEDFLHDETKKFVSQLFELLKEDPKTGKVTFKEPTARNSPPPPSPTNSERDDDDRDEDRDHKHARRDEYETKRRREDIEPEARKRRREDDRYRRDRDSDDRRYNRRDRFDSQQRYEGRRDYRDDERRDRRRRDRFTQERGEKTRPRCRDFEEKGYCLKGELCPYDHGSGYVVTDVQGLEQMKTDRRRDESRDSYDPDSPVFNKPALTAWSGYPIPPLLGATGLQMKNFPLAPTPMDTTATLRAQEAFLPPPSMPPFKDHELSEDVIQVGGRGMYNRDRNENRDRERRSHDDNRNKGDRPKRTGTGFTNHSQNTLAIVSIPEEYNNIEKLNSYFSQFGSIVNIQVRPQQMKAYVQFSKREEAEKAYSSPEAVFGNRFIKVYWAQKGQQQIQNKEDKEKKFAEFKKLQQERETKPTLTPATTPSPVAVAAKKKDEKAAELKKLQKEKEDLRKQQLEQTKKLLDSLSKMKNVDPKVKAELMKKIQHLTESVATSLAKDSSAVAKTTSAVKSTAPKSLKDLKQEKEKEVLDRELDLLKKAKQLQESKPDSQNATGEEKSEDSEIARLQNRYNSLKNMAAAMGIDPSSASPTGRPFKRPLKKTTRPRKRTMVLDNRTTTIRVDNIPDSLRDDDSLLNHFKTFGEVKNFTQLDNKEAALVQFDNRRAAENAMARGKTLKSMTLSLSWHNPKKTSGASEGTTQSESGADTEVVEELYQPGENVEEDSEEDEEEGEGVEQERSWKR